MNESCPLCASTDTPLFYSRKSSPDPRDFMRCETCELVFVPREFHVNSEAERERYLQHDNRPDDLDYRAFLSRLFDELRPHVDPGAKGLDFGSGPGSALAAMMKEEGFDVAVYDPYFSPDESALESRYDFITCTETAEHLRDPGREFARLDSLLGSPGWLGVMTGMLEDWDEFPSWYYHRDPTHVCFYSRATMHWLAQRHGWQAFFPRQNVVLFHRR